MGYGDEIIASGLARGAAKRGKLIAFGDGKKIIWSDQSKEIFKNNPNVAAPEQERLPNLEWVPYYRGKRFYGEVQKGKWKFFNYECPVGEIFFTDEEKAFGVKVQCGGWPFVVIEPRVKVRGATQGANKQWPLDRYAAVAGFLNKHGIRTIQFVPQGKKKLLLGVEEVQTPTFRHALAALSKAVLYIGPEGGLHHGAAAVGTNAVVIFGGFNTPKSTGYKMHENIAIGEPCGTIQACNHCREAMNSITVDMVIASAAKLLRPLVWLGVVA